MSKPPKLSKSQYCKGKRCIKAIWLYKNRRELAEGPSELQEQLFEQGNEVGAYAQDYFKGGVLIEEDHTNLKGALEHTQKALKGDAKHIYEATFEYNDVLVRVDVLRIHENNEVDLIEVKSTNSVKKEHLDDIAIQKYVLENCGFKVKKTYLMHLNSDYVRSGDLDLEKLFILDPTDEKIEKSFAEVKSTLEFIKAHLKLDTEPNELIGSKCKNPYPCEFKGYCWSEVTKGSIHTLTRISDTKRHELMDMGLEQLTEIPDDYKLTEAQEIQVKATKDKSPVIVSSTIRGHLDKLKWPLYFFDFESVSYALPPFDNASPYQQLPFQYSLHVQEKPDGDLKHLEFLNFENCDPRRRLAEQLIKDIPKDGGSIIVYHESYERMILEGLFKLHPDLEDQLRDFTDRLWDLEAPFAKRWYCDRAFEGSSSIKKVLPVFAPKLSYDDLGIQKGDQAQLRYAKMLEMPDDLSDKKKIFEDLQLYCERDTIAMVEILKELFEIINFKAAA